VTELARVERVLESDPATRARLGPKTCPTRKRNGDLVYFTDATLTVAQGLMARRLSPERAHVREVLRVAVDVLSQSKSASGAG
jgi:hypothetical protein